MAQLVKLIAPTGATGTLNGWWTGSLYTLAADRTVTVDARDIPPLLSQGYGVVQVNTLKAAISCPLPADLVSIVAAVALANGALTLAAQPIHARKLQYRFTYTSGTLATATVTTVGVDQNGNAVTDVQNFTNISASTTIKSAYAFASITSMTVSNVSGTFVGNIGAGVSNDFGVPTYQGSPGVTGNLTVIKATKITKVLGTSNTAADDVASTTTVDPIAATIAPTTAPAANGLVDYEFTYGFTATV
jgi:hypothetical protein